MRVRGLIAKLKKMPPNAVIAFRAHDQSEDEIDGHIRNVEMAPDSLVLRRRELGEDEPLVLLS